MIKCTGQTAEDEVISQGCRRELLAMEVLFDPLSELTHKHTHTEPD